MAYTVAACGGVLELKTERERERERERGGGFGLNETSFSFPDVRLCDNIGITDFLFCINTCRVPRKLFVYKAAWPSILTPPEGPSNC